MRRTISIGESILDTVYVDNQPVRSFVGGRIANAAASLATAGVPVEMVSECCNDHVGNLVTSFLQSHGVGTASVDRFTDGSTPVSMVFRSQQGTTLANYYNYPDDRFNVMWPRINEDDVILFGSFYSIDTSMRERFYELVRYAHERKAILVYLPGCQHGINCRITKVMPGILENLEMADIVVATAADIATLFPGETADQAFKNHIEFYCGNFLFIDQQWRITVYHRKGEKSHFEATPPASVENQLGWQAGLAAGVIYALYLYNVLHQQVDDTDGSLMADIVETALQMAYAAAADPATNCIGPATGEKMAQKLAAAIQQRQLQQ